jgi:hypothetical protein
MIAMDLVKDNYLQLQVLLSEADEITAMPDDLSWKPIWLL